MMVTGNKRFLLDNFQYRLSSFYPEAKIDIGTGNPDAKLVIVQGPIPPEKDPVQGALKHFNLLDDTYRVPTDLISPPKENRYYIRELIHLVDPLLVIICGIEHVNFMRQSKIRAYNRYIGKKFTIKGFDCPFSAVNNPNIYSHPDTPKNKKEKGRREWTMVTELFLDVKKQFDNSKWK